MASIDANGVADPAHTLDSLSIFGEPLVVRAGDATATTTSSASWEPCRPSSTAAGSPAAVLAPS
ncbi:MAG TPA: hypothetical protein VFC03_17495 [Acidimicrobiales bacterium]|nr:hypothetical protein [Acidimicrobiales bacterium]